MRRARRKKSWLGFALAIRRPSRISCARARFRLSLPLAALNTAAWVVLLYNSASSSEPGSYASDLRCQPNLRRYPDLSALPA